MELPTLTQGDISEYYDRFTALRERLYAEGAAGAGSGRTRLHMEAATAHVRQDAARG